MGGRSRWEAEGVQVLRPRAPQTRQSKVSGQRPRQPLTQSLAGPLRVFVLEDRTVSLQYGFQAQAPNQTNLRP